MSRYGFFPYNLRFTVGESNANLINLYLSDLSDVSTNLRPFMLHQHAHLELQLVLSGQGTFITKDAPLPFSPGQLILVPPETGHRLASKDTTLSRLIITLHLFHPAVSSRSEMVQRFFNSFHGLTPQVLTVEPGSELEHILFCLRDNVRRTPPDPLQQDFLRAQCTLLLLALHQAMPASDTLRPPRHSHSQQAMFIEDYLREHFADKNLADRLAHELHVSPRQLNRIVRNACGMNLREKLNSIRLSYAMEQLTNTDIPVTRVAQVLGYGSTTAFGSFIKNQTGFSPSQIRNSNHEFPFSPSRDDT